MVNKFWADEMSTLPSTSVISLRLHIEEQGHFLLKSHILNTVKGDV
jgi:hypothetical protein